jgi:UDP-N-acetylglucosamine 2-epimerase
MAPPTHERDERHDAALAVVVGAHHQRDVGSVTMIITDQKISETTQQMLSVVIGTGCGSSGLKIVWTV